MVHELLTPHGRVLLESARYGAALIVEGHDVAAALADAIRSGETAGVRASDGRVSVRRAEPWPAGTSTDPRERSIDVDMTNLSVIVDGAVVVKVISRWGAGGRAARQLATLAGSGVTPAYLGSLEWQPRDGDAQTVAMVSAFATGAVDGWTWAVDDVLAHLDGGPVPDWPSELGALTARMHRVLADASVCQTSGAESSSVDPRPRALAALDEAIACTTGAPGSRLSRRADSLRSAIADLPPASDTAVFELHGDLHVGQVLRSPEGYQIIDFDGDPQLDSRARDAPDHAARDVAHLLSSFDLVAAVVMRRRSAVDPAALAWSSGARRRFLVAYRAVAGDLLDEAQLPGMIAEQLLRELVYADRFLPRWRYAADGVISLRYAPDPTGEEEPWTPPDFATM